MNVFAKNLEILLMNHDLVMVPGFGGFLADYKQAEYDFNDGNAMLPPSRTIVFNKELKANDGLMVHAYMQTYDATYPQAYRQLELDIETISDKLNENGWAIIENIGTLHINIEGHITLEQIHQSVITPALFALPPLQLHNVEELLQQQNIQTAIEQTSMLPLVHDDEYSNGKTISIRRRFVDVAISSAAAVALFFLFAFPAFKGSSEKQYIAGPTIAAQQSETSSDTFLECQEKKLDTNKQTSTNVAVPATQIILLQAPQQGPVVISPQQLDVSKSIAQPNGEFTIVVTVAANEECALSLVNKLNKQNIPGAYYYKNGTIEYVLYSRFASYDDAYKTLHALKQVNKRFKKSWIMKLKDS